MIILVIFRGLFQILLPQPNHTQHIHTPPRTAPRRLFCARALPDQRQSPIATGDRGYDADWFRNAVQEKGIVPCPGRKSRDKPVKYGTRRYNRNPSRLEIRFGRPKDWRRVPIRYDRCRNVFRSVVVLTAPSCSGHGPVPDEMISA